MKQRSGKRVFASGATRNRDADGERYDLITPVGQRRLAKIYAEGAVHHGERNWEGGIPASVTLNHVERHLNLWKQGDRSEDHLAKIAWGCFAIMHYEETVPAMIDIPMRPEYRHFLKAQNRRSAHA